MDKYILRLDVRFPRGLCTLRVAFGREEENRAAKRLCGTVEFAAGKGPRDVLSTWVKLEFYCHHTPTTLIGARIIWTDVVQVGRKIVWVQAHQTARTVCIQQAFLSIFKNFMTNSKF